MGASVVAKASIVPIWGWIIPEPLAMPPTCAVRPRPRSTSTAASLGTVSVVMMARAASVSARRPDAGVKEGSTDSIRSTPSREPMSPVDAVRTWRPATPMRSAISAWTALASASPSAPVPALAQPALAMTAAACPRDARSDRMASSTGAARMRLRVNVAAAGTGPRSLTSSMTSGPSPDRSPARPAATRNPRGVVTPPFVGRTLTGRCRPR